MPGNKPFTGEIVEMRIVSATTRQTAINVQHWFVQSNVGGGATLQEIANAYDLRIFSHYRDMLSVEATYRGVGATNTAAPRSREFSSVSHAGVGGVAGTGAPTQVRGLLSWYADAAKPRNRGRTYIPFVGAGNVGIGGDPTGAYVVNLINLRDDMLPPLTVIGAGGTSTLVMCIRHRPPITDSPSTVATGVVRLFFATQRRSGAFGRQNVPPF